jgi:hypothetical protein
MISEYVLAIVAAVCDRRTLELSDKRRSQTPAINEKEFLKRVLVIKAKERIKARHCDIVGLISDSKVLFLFWIRLA